MNILNKIPAKYRFYIYAIGTLALAVYAIWEAAHGDIKQFVISLVSAVVTTIAAGNVDTSGNSVSVSPEGIAHVVTPTTEQHFDLGTNG